jgi:hypothetical protein
MIDWSIWNYLILQLSHQEYFIRDSVVAIGALIKSRATSSSDRRLAGTYHTVMAKMHKEFALIKYGKAIKSMKASLNSTAPRQVLIASLLIFCFEILLNNRHTALSTVVTGHALLQDWLVQHRQKDMPCYAILSPEPYSVDNELVQAFENLDLQISTVCDLRPVGVHRAILYESRNAMQHMPSRFHTLTEARIYLNLVMRRSNHFLSAAWPLVEATSLVREFSAKPPGPVTVITGVNIFSTSYAVPSSLLIEQREFLYDIHRWSDAFGPLYTAARLGEAAGNRDHIIVTLLRVHALATQVVITGVTFTDELSYDIFLPEFHEILALVSIVVDEYSKASAQRALAESGFLLGLGITPALYVLVVRCRDRALRRRAIDILRKWHPEACWTPGMIAEIGAFIMDVEEKDVTDDIIPEKARAVVTAVCEAPDQHVGQGQILVQCVQRRGGADDSPVWTEKMICYKLHS